MNEELEKLPNNLSDTEKEQKYKEILDNNKFAIDVMVVIYTLMMFSLPFVMAKEFLNKYKKYDQIKNNKQLVQIFDDLLKLWPLKAKSYSVYGSSFGIARVLQEFNKRNLLKKLEAAVKQEESQLEDEEKALCKTSSEVKNIMQITHLTEKITYLTEEDKVALRRMHHIMWESGDNANPDSYNDTREILRLLFDKPCFQPGILKKIFKEASKNSSVLQELQKSIDLLEDKLLKEKLLN